MAIRDPYDFDFDPPAVDGEMMISPATPISASPGASTFYMARRFEFPEGDYTFITAADDAATFWLGTSQLNAMLFASTIISEPDETTIYIAGGSYRLDVILQNLPAGPNPCYFSMKILRNGELFYASTADGWVLDDVAISDDDLPAPADYRFNLPVWSILPNWENGITERLTWLTDILDSETDAEQRRAVRRNARRSFEASFLRQRQARNRMDNFFVGVGPAPFMLPLWHEQVKMIDGIDLAGAGVVFNDGDFALREFRTGDLVFVNNGNPEIYDILQVGVTEQNRFSWAFPPPRRWPNGTRIYPMRVARIYTQTPKISNVTDQVARAQVLFDLVEPYQITPSFGASQNGEAYFHFPLDRANPLDVAYSRKNYVLDNQTGVPDVTDQGEFTATGLQARVRLFGREDAYAMRQFLQAARGKAKHFYAPTFMQDIYPQADIEALTTDLLIREQGFYKYMDRPQAIRIRLSFQFRKSVAPLYRDIVQSYVQYQLDDEGVAVVPPVILGEVLVLNEPLPAITLAELRRISFICETRFDQDSFEIHHPTNGQAMIEMSLVLRQSMNQRIGNPV